MYIYVYIWRAAGGDIYMYIVNHSHVQLICKNICFFTNVDAKDYCTRNNTCVGLENTLE